MNYTFTIITKSGDAQTSPRMSLPISGVFTTKESVPGSLATFETIDVKPSKITFRFVPLQCVSTKFDNGGSI
jgi:receptor-type tyrosine-protein phosphatase beta